MRTVSYQHLSHSFISSFCLKNSDYWHTKMYLNFYVYLLVCEMFIDHQTRTYELEIFNLQCLFQWWQKAGIIIFLFSFNFILCGCTFHWWFRDYSFCRSDFLTVATTRPETLFGDVALAVNPEVDRFLFLVGLNLVKHEQ